ncbi:vWA domain-containing protein [Nonomuraea polychroma]|uniref:vWA domain-containing protein n=1 Tax=Nonomuraea polychroma TaxID=46176 RepID=UPI003D8EA4E4
MSAIAKSDSKALRRYRFYFVVDVSQSMRDESRYGPNTPHSRLNTALPQLFKACLELPQLLKRTYFSVVTFSSKADVHLPSTLLDNVAGWDSLPQGDVTDYEHAFTTLHALIENDDTSLSLPAGWHWFNPIVFFITDGEPTADGKNRQPDTQWQKPRNALIAAHKPNIVALGFGTAQEGTLVQVATTRDGEPLAFVDNHSLDTGGLIKSIQTSILRSITQSTEHGTFDFPLPTGMRHVTRRAR